MLYEDSCMLCKYMKQSLLPLKNKSFKVLLLPDARDINNLLTCLSRLTPLQSVSNEV